VHHDTEARFLHLPLTTVRVFTEEIGKQQMAELVLRHVAEPGLPSEHFSVPTQLVKRQSCQLSSGWTELSNVSKSLFVKGIIWLASSLCHYVEPEVARAPDGSRERTSAGRIVRPSAVP